MHADTSPRPGMRLLRAGLRGAGRPLLRVAGWSILEAGPAAATGVATARALDDGFLAGRPLVGLVWLSLLGALHPLRAVAERSMFPHLAAVVEPLRDRLTSRLVDASLTLATRRNRPVDVAAVARLTKQVETVRSLIAALLRTVRPLVVTLIAAAIGLIALSPAAAVLVVPPLVLALAVYPLTVRALLRRR